MSENLFNDLFKGVQDSIRINNYSHRKKGVTFAEEVKEPTFNVPGKNKHIYSKDILLALAYNLAFQNIYTLKKNDTLYEQYFNKPSFQEAFAILERNDKKFNIQAQLKFRNIVYILLEELRNFNSHYFHPTASLEFRDVYNGNHRIKQDDWNQFKKWIEILFNDNRRHLLKSLENNKKLLSDKQDAILVNKKPEIDKKKKEINDLKGDQKRARSKSQKDNIYSKIKAKQGELNELKVTIYSIEIEQIDEAYKILYEIKFLYSKKELLSYEGRLFIAAMFLKKKELNLVLNQWQDFESKKGYLKTLYTMFSKYAVRDGATVIDHENNTGILNFKKITSSLSSLPMVPIEEMIPLYEEVNTRNSLIKDKINALLEEDYRLKLEKETKSRFNDPKSKERVTVIDERRAQIKLDAKSERKKIISIRKQTQWLRWMIQYIVDKKLIKSNDNCTVSLGYYKSEIDTTILYNKYGKISTTDIKNKIKELNAKKELTEEEQKQRLEWIALQKSIDQNFVFFELSKKGEPMPKLVDKPEYLKNENEKIHYILNPTDRKIYTEDNNITLEFAFDENNLSHRVTVVVSGWMILKWVFLDMKQSGDKTDICDKMIKEVKNKVFAIKNDRIKENWVDKYTYSGAYPKCIGLLANGSSEQNSADIKSQVLRAFKLRIEKLSELVALNKAHPFPYKYASKVKIDYVLDYLSFLNKKRSYVTQATAFDEASHRHSSLDVDTHQQAYEYIRFYGKYKEEKEFQDFLTQGQFKDYFKPLWSAMHENGSPLHNLEALFNRISEIYLGELHTEMNKVNSDQQVDEYARLFKIIKGERGAHQDDAYLLHAISHNLPISKNFIYLGEIFKDEYEKLKTNLSSRSSYKEIKQISEESKCQDPNYDFTLMRAMLSQENSYSNVDYIMKVLLPLHAGNSKVFDQPKLEGHKPRIKSTIMNHLLELKTQELMLWEVAKYYWNQTMGADYNSTHNTEKLDKSSQFNEVNLYQRILDTKIEVKAYKLDNRETKKTELKEINGKQVYIHIPAKKMDDEYMHFEHKYLGSYIEKKEADIIKWLVKEPDNAIFARGMDGDNIKILNNDKKIVLDFIELNNQVKAEINNAYLDIYLSLQLEKNLIDQWLKDTLKNDWEALIQHEHKCKIDRFYIPYEVIAEAIFKNKDYQSFRNKAMHANIQEKEAYRKKYIEKYVEYKIFQYYIDKHEKDVEERKKNRTQSRKKR